MARPISAALAWRVYRISAVVSAPFAALANRSQALRSTSHKDKNAAVPGTLAARKVRTCHDELGIIQQESCRSMPMCG